MSGRSVYIFPTQWKRGKYERGKWAWRPGNWTRALLYATQSRLCLLSLSPGFGDREAPPEGSDRHDSLRAGRSGPSGSRLPALATLGGVASHTLLAENFSSFISSPSS